MDLLGVWQREGVETADGSLWTPRIVRYVQTPRWFGDVRIPVARPDLRGAGSLAELDDAARTALAEQRGFFGYTTVEDDVATWHHLLDYGPAGGEDVGRIRRAGGASLYEHALNGSFVEHWWSLSSGDGRFHAATDERDGRLERGLVVAGDHFLYARAHPPGGDLLDCELSYGLVRGGRRPWEIALSTLPWREGSSLDAPACATVHVSTMTPDDLRVMFP